MLPRRLFAAVTIVAATALAGPPPAGADGPANRVMAVNQSDGRVATMARTALMQDPGPAVGAENVALARASCSDCRTVAVAVEVVTVDGPVTDFHPLNAAVAVNEACTRCATYAYARQEIIAVDGEFSPSDVGRDEIRRLSDAIDRLAASDEPFLQMGAELDGLVIQLRDAVLREIGRSGRHEQGRWSHRDADVRA
jgi:putative peptide zinc metalloprotease protein